ncbi:ATP-binding cassette domain-containing protein [Streptomyces sp. ISL-100]|uniref:ATP-binding cassette domain-containing protein n=1 Tax=Streptomyces sp. ISL-100 TaxID=2819173 RepID=UPI001BEA59E5|nr:ABC transporter ATP-binding protein [Streptomyces sp. ISL-100]MBT2394609.1 ABC transporter ATP-binding protein [Streptomyces sp. ISL-100]
MRLESVSKRYGRGRWILKDVHAEISPGEVVAFAGGNGSGKSTLLRMLVGITGPTGGRITGRPREVGYVPDRFSPNGRLSAVAYLTHMGRIRGMPTRTASARAHQLLDRLSLAGGKEARLHTLSKGNAQKVELAQALLVEPRLLVLDEPWSGLDASAHGVLAEIIAEVARSGGSVVFTDHRESVTTAHAARTYAVRTGRVALATADTVVAHRDETEIVLVRPDGGQVPHEPDWGALGALPVTRRGAEIVVRVSRERGDALLLSVLRSGWSVAGVTRGVRDRRAGEAVQERGTR